MDAARWVRRPGLVVAALVTAVVLVVGIASPVQAAQSLTRAPVPTVSGTSTVGKTLTAKPGAWAPAKVILSYQWLRSGSAINGATKSTYVLQPADGGKKVAVRVTGKKSGYTTVSKTSSARTIAKKLTSTPTPTIAGTAAVTKSLTAKPGTWKPGTIALSYQWLRSGTAIAGAKKSTYKLVAADAGKKIAVRVTGKRSGYATVTKTSAAKTVAGGTGTIAGTVKDAFGEALNDTAVDGLQVALCARTGKDPAGKDLFEGSGFCSRSTGITASGRYSTTVPAGKYVAWFEQTTQVLGLVPTYAGIGHAPSSRPVTVTAGKTVIVDMTLHSNRARLGGIVTSSLTGVGLADAAVAIYRKGRDGTYTREWDNDFSGVSASATTNTAGRWSAFVPAGTYKVAVGKGGFAETWIGGASSSSKATVITAPADRTQKTTVALAPTHATVSGRVLGSDGSAVVGAGVEFSRRVGGEVLTFQAVTDSLGRYSYFAEKGSWTVRVIEGQGLYAPTASRTLTIVAGRDVTFDLQMRLLAPPTSRAYGTVNGIVTEVGNSGGLGYVDVYAYRSDGAGGWPLEAQTTTAVQQPSRGAFTLKLRAGSYKLLYIDRSYLHYAYENRRYSAWSGGVRYAQESPANAPAKVLKVSVGGTVPGDVALEQDWSWWTP